ncbi:MAG: efflux RND transporter periplasmic adaptor subunit [Planctomycetota bacterium]
MARPPRPKPPRKRLLREIEFEEQHPLLRSFRPALRSDVAIVPQTFRGRPFYILQDPVSLQYFRVGENEFRIIRKFDGQRTLADLHAEIKAEWGDDAPGMNELANFVFSLRSSNLLVAEATDKHFLDRVREKRKARWLNTASNFLFLQVPLVDPDRFLNRTVRFVRWIYTVPVFLLWLAVVGVAGVLFVLHFEELRQPVNSVLAVPNLPLLWASFIFIKLFHEFGHAYAAKSFGSEVHRMGILFLVFTPCLYVDVTPVWAFPRKWTKVLVGCAGMLSEIFVASLALFLWLVLEPGPLRSCAFNVIFIASVSTVLFNANPLLRFDGYYILSDLIEMPNLRIRSFQYILYLAQRYLLGLEKDPPPHERSELAWLVSYGILAGIYRFFIVASIILFIAGQLFFVGVLIALVTAVVWLVIPAGKALHYLLFSPHTYASRTRIVLTVLPVVAALVVLIGFVPLPRHVSAPCVLQPREDVVVRPRWSGFVSDILVSDGADVPEGAPLLLLRNDQLDYDLARVQSEIAVSEARFVMLQTRNVAASQAEAFRLRTLREELEVLRDRKASLRVTAPLAGRVFAPDLERLKGSYVKTGSALLRVAALDTLELQVVLDEDSVSDVEQNALAPVRVRLHSEPDTVLSGAVTRIYTRATTNAPPAPLTNRAGGPVLLDPQSPERPRALLPWYRVDVRLDNVPERLLIGATGSARFGIGAAPLASQIRWKFLRVISKRFVS